MDFCIIIIVFVVVVVVVVAVVGKEAIPCFLRLRTSNITILNIKAKPYRLVVCKIVALQSLILFQCRLAFFYLFLFSLGMGLKIKVDKNKILLLFSL